MKKSIALFFLLAGIGCNVANAEDSNNEMITNSCADQDNNYCHKISFIDFKNETVSLDIFQKYDVYRGEKLKKPYSGSRVFGSEKIINNGEQFILAYAGNFVNTPGFRAPHHVYDVSLKNYSFQINAINGISLSNCIITRELIDAPGANDKITITRVDDQHYTCTLN